MLKARITLPLVVLAVLLTRPAYADEAGVLLLAHGGNAAWNAHVTALAAQVDKRMPTEVAFGMATRTNLQAAVDRLAARGVTEIVAVPLFVSSWSSVIAATEYLLGQRADAPADLDVFARMNHTEPAGAAGTDAASAGHGAHSPADATSPVTSQVPIRMTRALNDHPIAADILATRARSISRKPSDEAVVIVAHGPTRDDENRRWLRDMASLGERVASAGRFASVDYLTLRDDAPKPVRDQATTELRRLVAKQISAGRRVLIVPLLVSFGGIERGLRQRLEGLTYTMAGAGLVPDDRLVTWVLSMAGKRQVSAQSRVSRAEERHSIAGTVVDPQDRPISGAEVVIELRGFAPRTEHSGPDGVFRFTKLPAAEATVRISAAGFAPLSRSINTGEPGNRRFRLVIAPVTSTVTVVAADREDLSREIDRLYDRNKSVTSIAGEVLTDVNPVANYAALRLLPGVMNGGAGGRDRFSVPTTIRGGHTWGTVETIDQYPALDITPVAAEDGGYTAGLSSIVPAIAVQSLAVATGGLGVSYGQASGGVIRNYLKRGSAAAPSSSVRFEFLSLGEGVLMGDTGGGTGRVDYYAAAQSSIADYGTAYNTYPRPIEGLRLASGLVKIGVRTSARARWETMYVGGGERHDYFQQSSEAGRLIRRDYHTDKSNQYLASRYDWRKSENVGLGVGITQTWFHENRIEDAADGVEVNVSRRNRPQRATRVFANIHWRRALSESVSYSGSGGADLTWERFEDITAQPIAFSFREQAAYSRHSLALGSVTVNGGIRVANIENGFQNDVRAFYDAGAAWVVPSTHTRLFGSSSTGYKLNKAFYLFWGGGRFIRRDPAIGLRPSTTETVELGAEQPIAIGATGSGTIRIAWFSARQSDLFNFGNTGTGIPFYDGARTRGAEMWTEWRIWRLRPFASFTWVRSYRDRSTNPNVSNVDLRFAPLPNCVAGFGSHIDLHTRLAASVYGIYDDGGVAEQRVNDDIVVTRFGSFSKVNAAIAWSASSRWRIFSRMENLLNRRDLGFDRTIISPAGNAQRVAGTQRDPGLVVSAGIDVRF